VAWLEGDEWAGWRGAGLYSPRFHMGWDLSWLVHFPCCTLSHEPVPGSFGSGQLPGSLSGTVTLDINQINQSGTGSMYMYCTVVKHVLHSWDSHMVCRDNFPPPQGERTITRNTMILIRLYHCILELYNFILHKRKGELYSNKGQLEEFNFQFSRDYPIMYLYNTIFLC
jgi:hypothetical protein